MDPVQTRSPPQRIYENNITHNPFTWMGVWTPHGWRVHRKRFGKARRLTVPLSGDGRTTFFPEALVDPDTGGVQWQDDLHLTDDPFTDTGHFPCDPRVEYPVGRPRWAVSHTLLCCPVADHTLYTHEYTWDMRHGHLQTHFRKHVALEQARTDARDGLTVSVAHRPISRVIEGNVQYPLPNSAVRGVWAQADKSGANLYTRRCTQLLAMHNALYGRPPHTPIVQCHGLWPVVPGDPTGEAFDKDSGLCTDRELVAKRMLIPLDEPKLSSIMPRWREVQSKIYEGLLQMLGDPFNTVDEEHLSNLRSRLGQRYEVGKAGYSAANEHGMDTRFYRGYAPEFDLNGNGVIDEEDEQRIATQLGRKVRQNLYVIAYFGGDWVTGSASLDPEHPGGLPVVADYSYGAGYDGLAGTIRLFKTPGPDRPVWVEYHHDAPADEGENNIRLHLYREID
jgi:hypothetical protein